MSTTAKPDDSPGQASIETHGWQNGLEEAVARMHEHLASGEAIKFDARDRLALAFILRKVISPDQWVVRFSNYEPAEIDSIHFSKAAAEARMAALDKENPTCTMWEIEKWESCQCGTGKTP